jgi:hypothetical protein
VAKASRAGVKVEGVRELQKALRDLGAEAGDLKAVHLEVAEMLVPGIEQRTPRRSGDLAGSWVARSTKGRARITSTQPYAGVIEYGWPARGIEPARMVRDTVEASSAEILDTYERGLERVSQRIGFETKG